MMIQHDSRKQRQLKYLVKRLNALLQKSEENLEKEINNLVSKIKHLVSQLNGIISTTRMRKILGAAALLIGVSFVNTSNAQSFAAPTLNPFGFTPNYTYFTAPAVADLDSDGDLDILTNAVAYSQYSYGLTFAYEQNIGSPTNPQFSLPLVNPFGLSPVIDTALLILHNLVDMDNDGDFDILSNVLKYNYDTTNYYSSIITNFKYYENIGSATTPLFSNPISSPFGLVDRQAINISELADIDNDGDMDIISKEISYGGYYSSFIFFENIGTPSSPQFSIPQTNPFGLNITTGYVDVESPEFIDIDGDGDMDLLCSFPGLGFKYYENTGNQTNPQFSLPGLNPFGLIADTSSPSVQVIESGDMDSDGDMDIIVGQYYGNIVYYENTSSSTNINEANNLQLRLYPNPATNYLNIQCNTTVKQIDIFNTLGEQVTSQVNPKSNINIEKLKKGTYFVEILFEDNKLIRKFTK